LRVKGLEVGGEELGSRVEGSDRARLSGPPFGFRVAGFRSDRVTHRYQGREAYGAEYGRPQGPYARVSLECRPLPYIWAEVLTEPASELPHEVMQANRMKPFNRIKGRNSLVTLQRSPLRGLRVPFVVQPPKSPFDSVCLCRLLWSSTRCSGIHRSHLLRRSGRDLVGAVIDRI